MTGIDSTQYLSSHDCPDPLRRWADKNVRGSSYRSGRELAAGWVWDGVSDEIVVLTAPKGHRYEPIPDHVQVALRDPSMYPCAGCEKYHYSSRKRFCPECRRRYKAAQRAASYVG